MMRKMKARSIPDLVKMVAKLDLDGLPATGKSWAVRHEHKVSPLDDVLQYATDK